MKMTFFTSFSLMLWLFMLTACRSNVTVSPTIVLTTEMPLITSTSMPHPTDTPVSTPTLGVGSNMIGEDGATLIYIPEGEFTMGSEDGNSDEQPVHTVYLDAFWIDQTEVTNKLFAAFISATGYQTDAEIQAKGFNWNGSDWVRTNGSNWQHPAGPKSDITGKENHPVIHVSWNDAVAYCKWANGSLPTEAQWEKAARGTDSRVYPWGDDVPNMDLLNYNSDIGDTTEVASYETGKSFYGAYDMAGNAWEWVGDRYSETYYQSSPSSNPLGPAEGKYRVLRGGSWGYTDHFVRSTARRSADPEYAFNDVNIGFRCVRSPNTPLPQPIKTSLPISTSVAPSIGSITYSEKDGAPMVYVPEGEFTMGSFDGYGNAELVHAVYLDAFWIDQTEVTNKQYAACVSAGECTLPSNTSSATRSSYYGNSEFDDYPVIYVDWSQAANYCSWAGRKLPSEAQWEKAANGADPRISPWNDPQNMDLLINSSSDTSRVGTYETGKSSYGAYDMAGNVWEWVNDWYEDTYYQVSPYLNPLGPDVGQYRVLRGGSWNVNLTSAAVPFRFRSAPVVTDSYFGFRCAFP